ncbi:uncharacterized protein LOC131651253 [Vicia villosa]|uniref:uncharacterized protein LOC131648824 n=1 Tax=Vicia villosa TaxID=3911 RepID=UPI00273C82E2|nr:uncharacterized protein LOC131648824 [Vicia villosa]XP_058776909.1 uncharacterized protein LOC131651253 [Vicia villosa]
MAGRNDAAIAATLDAMAQALEHQPNAGENARSRSLATFQRENPLVFKGKHDPDGELELLKAIERIFRVMDCTQAQKVRYGTHMLAVEVDDLWLATRQRLEAAGEEITWPNFIHTMMERVQIIVCSEIKKAIGYQQIRIFPNLVDSCRIFEEDNAAHYQQRGKPYDAPAGKGK